MYQQAILDGPMAHVRTPFANCTLIAAAVAYRIAHTHVADEPPGNKAPLCQRTQPFSVGNTTADSVALPRHLAPVHGSSCGTRRPPRIVGNCCTTADVVVALLAATAIVALHSDRL